MSNPPSTVVAFHIIGDAFIDLFCFVEGNLPQLGGDSKLSQPVQTMAGGSATNSATHLMGLLGPKKETSVSAAVHLHATINPNDDYGKLLLSHAIKHGYHFWNCVKTDESTTTASTGHCLVIVCQGDRSFMTHAGVVDNFAASDIRVDQILSDNNNGSSDHIHVHVAGYYNIVGFWNGKLKERLEYLISSTTKNLTLSLVPQFDASGAWSGGLLDLLPLLDFMIMNEDEANYITKNKHWNDQDKDSQHWAQFFQELCSTTWIIVTCGKQGATAIHNGTVCATQRAVLVDMVDPTGAGDAFISGFLHGIWEWKRQQQSKECAATVWNVDAVKYGLVWGCSVATCSVLTKGASVPSSTTDVERFVKQTMAL
jgi:sugar/nucleoside kinase (ribokinase family)